MQRNRNGKGFVLSTMLGDIFAPFQLPLGDVGLIKEVREELGLSQEELGFITGLSGKTINNYETGRTVPADSFFYQLGFLYTSMKNTNNLLEFKSNIKKSALSRLTGVAV